MDIERPDLKRKKLRKKRIYSSVLAIVVICALFFIYMSEPSIPKVAKRDVWLGDVKSGEFVHRIEGMGTLIPLEQRWITAQTSGQVESIELLPGTWVEADSVIITLSNPEIVQELESARLDLLAAQAELNSATVRLKGDLLALQSSYKELEEASKIANIEAEIDEELAAKGLVSILQLKRSQIRANQLQERLKLENDRMEFQKQSIEPELSVIKTQLMRAESQYALLEGKVDGLKVKAGFSGILQKLTIEDGMLVEIGTAIAQVANPRKLKASIKIPEGQTKEIDLGQLASVDTRTNGVHSGKVWRVDPNVESGYVQVDIVFDQELPEGCRADQTVDGQITLKTLSGSLFIDRPAEAFEDASMQVFVVDGDYAKRKNIRLGKGSVSQIQVLDGLMEGQEIILSDTSRWANSDTLRIQN